MPQDKKRSCMKCNKKEFSVCCTLECNTRLCKRCYDSYSIHDVTEIEPPSNHNSNHNIPQGQSIDEENESVDGLDTSSECSDEASQSSDMTPRPFDDLENHDERIFSLSEPDDNSGKQLDLLKYSQYNIQQDDIIDDDDVVPFSQQMLAMILLLSNRIQCVVLLLVM